MVRKRRPKNKEPLEFYNSLTESELLTRIETVRRRWGKRLLVLVHYYQKPKLVRLADAVGDSFALSKAAAKNPDCETILFCGVRFMAETADILANDPKIGKKTIVLSPDPEAGCPMADMAAAEEIERAWQELGSVIDTETITPVTYVNSSAEIKAFCGRHGGTACTSSNASAVLKKAFSEKERVFFLPDQHLGRNTSLALGIPAEEIILWNGRNRVMLNEVSRLERDGFLPDGTQDRLSNETGPFGGNTEEAVRRAKVILWNGFCPVHQRFTMAQLRKFRAANPQGKVLVHPECPYSLVAASDEAGSTKKILDVVQQGEPGSVWGIGTERRMVESLAADFSDRTILPLAEEKPICEMMDRMTLANVCRTLEALDRGEPVQTIEVPAEIAEQARKALERMLACTA